MHEIGVSVVWLSLQVTIVAVGASLFYWCVRSRGPLLRSLVLSSFLMMTLLLAGLLLSPWPRWSIERSQLINSEATQMTTTAKEQDAAGMTDSALSLQKQIEQESVWSSAWSGFVEGLKNKQPLENQDTPLTWPAMIAFLFLAGLTAGFLRLCVGYILLKREVKHSTELDGTSARELLDGLLLEHSSVISLRESTRLATAAVVGWWHPVILLPETWRGWSTDQLRAVLTHELTHILQGDFLSNLCAEISRSVYFYHPLMHWLVARLRLEQELAADAAAAHSSGGTESYLVILAEMAMVQSNRRVRGPARAFLPTQSTFLRRIDMLKENTPYRGSVSRSTRWGIIAIVMSAGILAVGFRGNEVTIAQDTLQTTISANDTKTSPETLRIDLIPNNALAVLMVRPEQILNQDSFKPIRDLLKQLEDKNSKDSGILGFKPQEIETATIIFMAEEAPAFSVEVSGIVIQTNKEIDREAAISNLGVANQAAQYKGQTYLKNIVGSRSEMRLFLDKHTLIFTTREKDMQAMIDTMQQGGTRRWAKQWQSIRNASVAWVIDMRVARAIVGNKPTQLTAANAPVLGVISPIWENTNVVSLGLSVHQNLSINATLSQDQNGESVRDTLDAVLILARNMLSQMRQNISGDNVQERLALMSLMDTAAQAMKSIKVTQNGEDVAVAAMLPEDTVSQLVAIMVPAVMQAREAASRAHSLNNIKQIVLALYGYHDKYKHFPPAVLIGPDGKTPYSWRVALLPFLEQQALYDEYDRNEPWDSEHNKKVLAKMPAIYRCPTDHGNKNDAAYFVIVGNNTAFGQITNRGGEGLFGGGQAFGAESRAADNKQAGIRFQDIVDGTSNTIAVVEAKRDIPWTKPEDITYDGKKLPVLGGIYQNGFNVGFCDGAARFISEKIDPKTLNNLLQINDGIPVDLNTL